MPNTHTTLSSLFTDIANAIRSKTGGSAQIVADDFPTEIANIPSGGIDPSDATATASEILYPETAYISTGKVTGQMSNNGAWTSSVTPSSSAQTVTIPEGYHNGNGYVNVGAGASKPTKTLVGTSTFTASGTRKVQINYNYFKQNKYYYVEVEVEGNTGSAINLSNFKIQGSGAVGSSTCATICMDFDNVSQKWFMRGAFQGSSSINYTKMVISYDGGGAQGTATLNVYEYDETELLNMLW